MNPDPVAALDAEWEASQAKMTEVVVRWACEHHELAACGSAAEVLERIRKRPDPTLRRLIAIAQAGGPDARLAAFIIVKSMLGKLILMARTERSDIADWIGALWLIIHDHPLRRRPQRIAANLSLDTRKAVLASQDRRQISVDAASWDQMADAPVAEPSASEVLRAASRLGLLDATTHAVLTSVYADGLDGRRAARAHHTTPGTIRWRCSRAVRLLAAHRAELLAAA